jgi:hypothetical protein
MAAEVLAIAVPDARMRACFAAVAGPLSLAAQSCYSEAMTPELPTERSDPNLTRFVLYSLPYLLLAYILSTGPLYWQIYGAYCVRGSGFLFYFYYPLVLANEIPYVRNFFDWYLQFWI